MIFLEYKGNWIQWTHFEGVKIIFILNMNLLGH